MTHQLRALPILLTLTAVCARPAAAQRVWAANGVPVCTHPASQSAARIAGDNGGGAWVVWEDTRNADTDVFLQHLSSFGGTEYPVSTGKAVCTATGEQRRPTVLADGQHGAFLAWTDVRSVRQIYLQYVRPGSLLLAGDGVPAITTLVDGGQDHASLVPSGTGQAILLDWHWGGNCGIGQYHHRAGGQKMTAQGSRLWGDAGALFAGSGCPVNETDLQMVPVGVATGLGGALICYDRYLGPEKNIYAKLVASDGSATPATGFGLPISEAVGDQRNPVVTTNQAGGAIVAWEDNRTSPTAIYAQWIFGSGAQVRWTANGRLIAAGTGALATPSVASDGAGGAWVVWEDHTNASDVNLYAQHVTILGDTTGVRLPLCTAAGNQGGVSLVEDGAGGVIAAWWDERGGFRDIYAQHLVPAGACGGGGTRALWDVNGYSVCTAPFDQDEPQVASDGYGGAIVAWKDARAGFANTDVYAQRLHGGCTAATDAAAAAGRLPATLTVTPNPMRGAGEIGLVLSQRTSAHLAIYTVTGERVQVLAAGAFTQGTHTFQWNGRRADGRRVPNGIYLVRLSGGHGALESKLVLVQ